MISTFREVDLVAADESLDTGTAGRTELRIHGVSGIPPESVLDHPLLKRVAGDDTAGFFRRWYPSGRSADLTSGRRVEAYCWGRLTSGPAARSGWIMLLPFMLANVAHWMLPAVPAEATASRAAAGRASAVALRLFGLVLTFTLVLTAVQVAVDIVGWQCAGIYRCGTSSPLTTLLADGWLSEPGRRIVVSALVPLAVIAGVALLGRRPLRRTTPEPDVAVAAQDDHPLAHASFWRGNPGMPALRSAHVAAATALLAAAVAWPATTLAATGAMQVVGWVLCLASLATVAVATVLVAAEGVAGRGGSGSVVVRTIRRAATVLLVLGAVYSVWDHGSWEPAGRLPGVRPAILLTFGLGLVLLLLLTLTVLSQRPWNQGGDGFRPAVRGFGTPAVATIAYLIAGGFSAGLTYRIVDLLGYPVLSQHTANTRRASIERAIADESLPFAVQQAAWSAETPLVVPPSFAWAGAAATVIFVAVLVIAGGIAVATVRRIGPLATQVATEYTRDDVRPAPTPTDAAVRTVARAVAVASITDRSGRFIGYVVMVAGVVLLAGLGVYVAGVDNWRLVEQPPLSTLTAFGTWLMGAFALGLIALVWRSARNPELRRTVGILWDIGSFWPRAAHPLAPPCYGERAVPDLVERVEELTAQPADRVVISGHSQGSVLAAATVLQLPPDVADRVSLVTIGSPLRRLYARYFPAYFDAGALGSLPERTGGRYRNLYRDTDPIASWVLNPPHEPGRVDIRLADPLSLDQPVNGHADYWADVTYRRVLDELPTSR